MGDKQQPAARTRSAQLWEEEAQREIHSESLPSGLLLPAAVTCTAAAPRPDVLGGALRHDIDQQAVCSLSKAQLTHPAGTCLAAAHLPTHRRRPCLLCRRHGRPRRKHQPSDQHWRRLCGRRHRQRQRRQPGTAGRPPRLWRRPARGGG